MESKYVPASPLFVQDVSSAQDDAPRQQRGDVRVSCRTERQRLSLAAERGGKKGSYVRVKPVGKASGRALCWGGWCWSLLCCDFLSALAVRHLIKHLRSVQLCVCARPAFWLLAFKAITSSCFLC